LLLKKQPVPLPHTLWEPLKKNRLVWTPKEFRIHLLNNAPASSLPETPYSTGVKRALKAALALDDKTKNLKVIFKSGAKAELDLLVFHSTLQINDKWLRFQDSHQRAPCWLSLQSKGDLDMDHFSCTHIVTDLYKLMLEELTKYPWSSKMSRTDISESCISLYQQVRESLHKMAIMVTATPGTLSGEIDVSWTDSEGDILSRVYGLDPQCKVTLHLESTCSSKRSQLLAPGKPFLS
jgi:hypothetical protein